VSVFFRGSFIAPQQGCPNSITVQSQYGLRRSKHRPIRRSQKRSSVQKQRQTTSSSELVSVFNLSTKVLTSDHLAVLSKGLSFVPKYTPSRFELSVELYKLNRTLVIQERIGDDTFVSNPLRLKSLHDAKTPNSTVQTFSQQVQHTVESISPYKTYSNLSKSEWDALQDLAHDPSIVVRPADKGGGIVVLDYVYYRNEILSQLHDEQTYRRLTFDPTATFKKRIDNLLNMGLQAGYLDQVMFDFCTVSHPIMPILYMLPKLHQDPRSPPGRPIVSARGSLLEPLGKLIDHLCKESILSLSTGLKDTPHFLSLLSCFQLPTEPIILVALDVKSLYTIIPHEEGILAFIEILQASTVYHGPPLDYLREVLQITLGCNFFSDLRRICIYNLRALQWGPLWRQHTLTRTCTIMNNYTFCRSMQILSSTEDLSVMFS
uniref:Reverse transcriptase domain-containing protein n=1 Tax=Leptobrachium leishanense TaxID=445787 RepID=A0A8C5R6D6_9ANUR